MKNLFLLIIFFCINVNAQSNEFKVYDNGLIYSENAVSKLNYTVDSLNLRFKTCKFNKIFLSCAQTKANFIRLEKESALEAKIDLENNISYSKFKAKYPKATFDDNLFVVKSFYGTIRGVKSVEISSLELGKSKSKQIITAQKDIDSYENKFKGKWIFQFYKKTKYSEASLNAFYFIEEFKTKPVSDKYAKLIQYSDCMIDTTAHVFFDNAKVEEGLRAYDPSIPNRVLKFNRYIGDVLKKPTYNFMKVSEDKNQQDFNKKKYETYKKQLDVWESFRFSRLDSLRNTNSNFMPMLNAALIEAKENKVSDDEFEEYVGHFLSKEIALDLKRNRRVSGGCSMDSRPRNHALNIAKLSAETAKWDIFLRSHLDIMNDRFDRVSDGSYAQAERNTYVKEIEVLDLNVMDLILGISLRIENPASNHYFSSINRVGRALSESKNKKLIETTILDMISDKKLDDYNRILMYYLFENYNNCLVDENSRKQNESKLNLAIAKLPSYISSRIILKN